MKSIKLLMVCVLLSLSFGIKAEDQAKTVEPIVIEVYRSPSCGCCSKWLVHLKENQFDVIDHVTDDVQAIKDKYGVPENMASCHTALVNGYVVEGHVPASDIKKLLKLKPAVIGISVPGMPSGTPGMEMGGRKDAYQVVSFDKEKKYQVFSSYEAE
jgi:hypothetical protein